MIIMKTLNIMARIKHFSIRVLPRKKVFTDIYRGGTFGGEESISGPGSDLAQTALLRRSLPSLLKELGVRSMIDAPCGDFNWLREVDLGTISYIGVDIVDELIKGNEKRYGGDKRKFIVADIVADVLPAADMILCRDCFVHLSNKDIIRAIKRFKKSGSRYLLTTIFPSHQENVDMVTGRGWRPINLTLPPFSFPPPLKLTSEECPEQGGNYADKSLGLWELSAIKTSKYV